MLEEIYKELPNIKIMILEPFVLEGSATCNTEEIPDKWNIFNTEVKKRAQMAKSVAQKNNILFVPLQDKFDAVSENTENSQINLKNTLVNPKKMGYSLTA